MINNKEAVRLVDEVHHLLKYKKKIESLKGENFNVFSILKMERMENRTHSAFINELLNPKGTHLKGGIFLEHFLNVVENSIIDPNSSKVELEKPIGKRDDIKKTGGRIDIFISDSKDKILTIENKIDGKDQDAQIERYCNYLKDRNTVYYLNLEGEPPHKKSRGTLKAGEDYYIISYKNHILKWLELCMKETTNEPILRESIKQYIILIKKITHTMDNKEQKELIDIMLRHYEESLFIASNFNKAKQKLTEKFRVDLYNLLQSELGSKYQIIKGNDTSNRHSQIWIKPLETQFSHLYFGVESFSGDGNFDNKLIIGVFNNHAPVRTGYADVNDNESDSKWWINIKPFEDFRNVKIKMNNPELIILIHSNPEFRECLIKDILRQIEDYLKTETEPLLDYINRKK